MTNTQGSTYPPISLDSNYGQVVRVSLDKVDAVVDYLANVVLGTLTGGTSPAWTVTGSNPLITHISLKANNQTIRDFDTQMLYEYMKIARGQAVNGLALQIPMTDIQYATKHRILNSLFPSYSYTQIYLELTIAPLANITSGSPTGSTGTTLYLTEQSLARSAINFKIFDFRMLQIESALALTGNNSLTQFLATDGYYKSLMYFANTGGSYATASDTLVNTIELILNLRSTIKQAYWSSLKIGNQALFGQPVDTGYAFEVFMENADFTQLLALDNPIIQKSVNAKVNTTATGQLYALKNIYVG